MGFIFPVVSKGQTFLCSLMAMSALKASFLALNVDPDMVSRFSIMDNKLISAFAPFWIAICTSLGIQCPAFQITRKIVAAYHVEYNIHAFTVGKPVDFFNKVLFFVVNGGIRAEFPTKFTLDLRTCGNDNLGMKGLGELYSRCAYTAAAAVYQQCFVGQQTGAVKYIAPDGEKSFR